MNQKLNIQLLHKFLQLIQQDECSYYSYEGYKK
jgi:hypothetical protein